MDRFNLTHTYDALNRLTSTNGDQGYKAHTYTYDSLGNLIKEKIHNKSNEYWYNELNQQIQSKIEEKTTYNYTFDNRGNLIAGKTGNKVVEAYTYDATNRMVKGVNESGEESHYVYNGLGYLVGNEWIIAKNAYGYNGVSTDPSKQVEGVVRVCTAHKNTSGQGHQNPTGAGHFKDKGETNDGGSTTGGTTGGTTPTISSKHAVVHKDYVIDYTSALGNVIMETESGNGGLTYRYAYGLDKVSAAISGNLSGAGNLIQNGQVKLWYHHDRLGTTEYLTDNVSGKVTSYVSYDSWGAIEKKPNLKMGVRELDLVTEYTGYMYDQVLGVYYAKARMYDAADRRFMAEDPVKGGDNWYAYCGNNPVSCVDPTGLFTRDQLLALLSGAGNYTGSKLQMEIIQEALNFLGYKDPEGKALSVNGFFGERIKFAIKWFQIDYNDRHPSMNIFTDGFPNQQTWVALKQAFPRNERAIARNRPQNASIPIPNTQKPSDIIPKEEDPLEKAWQAAKDLVSAKIKSMLATISGFTKHFSDAVRREDVMAGISSAAMHVVVQSAATLAVPVLGVISFFVGPKPMEIIYKAYENGLANLDRNLLAECTYPDSYYVGKVIGDVFMALVGAGYSAKAILEMIYGAASTIGGTVTAPTGVGALFAGLGIALTAKGVISLAAGVSLTLVAVGNIGGDVAKYSYYDNLNCSSGGGGGSGGSDYSWGNPSTLQDHFDRHGSDFGFNTPEEYAKAANDFYNSRYDFQIKVDNNGVIRAYDSSTNTFGSYNADGTTRTFYKPTDGQAYFDRQPGQIIN